MFAVFEGGRLIMLIGDSIFLGGAMQVVLSSIVRGMMLVAAIIRSRLVWIGVF